VSHKKQGGIVRTCAEIQSEITEFEAELARLRKELVEAKAREVEDAKKRVAEIMKTAGLTVDDVLKPADKAKVIPLKAKSDKPPREPIYKDPVSGKTWNGLGRAPGWFAEKDEKEREKLRIPKAA
jgi:DNA-binding protein H-NS